MQHATQAYKNVANETSSLRELEANLLLNSAARFQAIREDWERRKIELNEALLFNRKLWTIFLAAMTRDDNPLPSDLRQNVTSLGVFVINRTLKLTGDPKPEGLGTLIKINCELAAGLLSRA
jgi:flagellar protein FlaF